MLHREFAKGELRAACALGIDYATVLFWGEKDIWLVILDRAVAACTQVQLHNGGWGISGRKAS